jgi:hypothetical protein
MENHFEQIDTFQEPETITNFNKFSHNFTVFIWVCLAIFEIIIINNEWNNKCDKFLHIWLILVLLRLPVDFFIICSKEYNEFIRISIEFYIAILCIIMFIVMSFGHPCSESSYTFFIVIIHISIYFIFILMSFMFQCLIYHTCIKAINKQKQLNIINTVPITKYDPEKYPINECSICYTNYVDDGNIRELPCKHYYHSKCIDEWFSTKNTCPICRYIIK